MNLPKTILTISRDKPLQSSRTLLLKAVGYRVLPLGQDDIVHAFLATDNQPEINLVLLCHSVPEPSRIALCAAFKKRYPKVPILMLYNGYDLTAAAVDGQFENLHSPEALVPMINMLLSRSEKAIAVNART